MGESASLLRACAPLMNSYCARLSNVGVHDRPCFAELTTDGETFIYEQVNFRKDLEFGEAVIIEKKESEIATIDRLPKDTEIFPARFPSVAQFETVNYTGTIMDCYDPVFGSYNWDNQAVLFTCGMLLNIEVHKKYTFENLHCVSFNDIQGGAEWLKSVIGCPFPTAFGVVFVFCPVYSNLKGSHWQQKPALSSKVDFASLLAAYSFLKTTGSVPKALIDFQFLEKFAAAALHTNYDVSFINHCCSCQFTHLVTDHSGSLHSKYFFQAKQVKDLMIDMKAALKGKVCYSNTAHSKMRFFNNEILHGRLRARSRNVFEFLDLHTDTSVTLIDQNGLLPAKLTQDECIDVIFFNAHAVVEMIPRLEYANTWSTKAYIWLSNIAKVVCRFKVPNIAPKDSLFSEYKLLRKYSQRSSAGEATFIEIQSLQSCKKVSKALKADGKFYGLVAENSDNDSFFTLVMSIKDAALNSPEPLGSESINPTLKPKLEVSCDQFGRARAVSVHLDDLAILSGFTGINEFSVTVRIYSIKEAFFTLKCTKCNIQIKGGECLMHKTDFVPLLQVKVAFVVGDDLDGRSSILIESFDQICMIMAWKPESVQKQLEKVLSGNGEIRFSSEELSLLTAGTTFLQKVVEASPYRSRRLKLTFPFKVLKSVLKPSEIEICDAKSEILNLIRYFDSQMSLIK